MLLLLLLLLLLNVLLLLMNCRLQSPYIIIKGTYAAVGLLQYALHLTRAECTGACSVLRSVQLLLQRLLLLLVLLMSSTQRDV